MGWMTGFVERGAVHGSSLRLLQRGLSRISPSGVAGLEMVIAVVAKWRNDAAGVFSPWGWRDPGPGPSSRMNSDARAKMIHV